MTGPAMSATETACCPRFPHSAHLAPAWEQLSADLIEISQRKHDLRPCQVLGQAAVSHFGEAPQLLDYAKGVFAARPGPRTRPVDRPPAFAQRPATGSPIDPVAHPPGL